MKIENIVKKGGYALSWLSTLEGQEYLDVQQGTAKLLQQQVQIPGFRPGKAPLAAVKATVGEQAFYKACADNNLTVLYTKTAQEQGFEPVGDPSFEVIGLDKNQIVWMTRVNVFPDFTLKEYKGLTVSRPDWSVSEAEIDGEVEKFRRRHMVVVNTGRAAQDDDVVYFSFAVEYDGPEFAGSSGKGAMQHLDQPELLPGLNAQLQGKKPGEMFIYEMDVPADDVHAHLAGKHVVFHIRVDQVKQRFLPEITDELFVRFKTGCSNLAEYREKIRTMNEKERKEEGDSAFRSNLDDALAAQVSVRIPPEMMDLQLSLQYAKMGGNLLMDNLTIDGWLEEHHMTREQLRDFSAPQAEKEIKVMLALDKIAELEGITEENDEKRAKLARQIVIDNANIVIEAKAE